MNPVGHAGFGAGLALPAFAKINLGLELLGRRPDGYWEIRTLYQTVALHDRLRLRLTRASGALEVRVRGGGAPAGRANLIHRLLARARRLLGLRRGVEVELEKEIPAGRGLGGGSSDAAAALIGLLRLARIRLPLAEMARLGAQVGADVPFFFLGGRALGVSRGDEVHALEDASAGVAVLVCPPLPIVTREAYRWAGEGARRLTPGKPAAIIVRRPLLANALWAAGNDFEPVVFARFPELARIKRALFRAGAWQAGLSGSGSTVYGLFARRAAARRAAAVCVEAGTVFVVDTVGRGAYRRATGLAAVIEE
ncbi:MAG: 4-(cytidine 5'-diphospho)-2-C-methyl-D-erythritol kinase [Candidatus Acidiferrales bacterium]